MFIKKPTNKQEAIDLLDEIESYKSQGLSIRALCQQLNLPRSNITRWIRQARNIVNNVEDGYKLKGKSTLRDAGGNIVMEWVKTCEDTERKFEMVKEAIQELTSEIEPIKPIKCVSKDFNGDLMTVIPMGDPHIGLLTWEEEVGEKFNLEIAVNDLFAASKHLIDQSPNSEKCIIINLGDFFHADNMDGKTARSGHVLDMACRTPEMIKVGMKLMRYIVEYAAKKFKAVEVINAIGNHDDVLAVALSAMLDNLYEGNKRVTIHSQATGRHYIRHGKVLIGVTHGHKTKDKDLPLLMATEKKEDWGQTSHRYFYRGHHHHDERIEYNGCMVEQFRTLAPSDAYSHGAGYLSGRDLKAIIMHREYGEVGRAICSIDMLRNLNKKI